MQCLFRVGFFIVRDCGREGAILCSQCGKAVCDAHRKPIGESVNPTLMSTQNCICLTCLPVERDLDRDSRSHSDGSSSGSSSSYSGQGGQFGGGGASGAWSTGQGLSPVTLGAIPSGQTTSGLPPLTSIEAAGLSQSDADLFDEVSNFDEKSDDRSSFDS